MAWQRLRRLILIGTLTVAWLTARPTPSLACSCVAGPLESDVVFQGRVVVLLEGAWVRERLHVWTPGVSSTVALLNVEQMLEGPPRPFYTVLGGTGQGNCAIRFERGVRYQIHGRHRRFGPLETNMCLGSHSLRGNPLDTSRTSRSLEDLPR